MPAKLSVLIVARNEERLLPGCLATTRFADEVVVVLDRSTDQSATIARGFGAAVIEGSWPVEGERRNHGIAACTGDWILELDADERISAELAGEIPAAIASGSCDYYLIPFHNYVGGIWVRYGWGAYNGVSAKQCLFAKGGKHWGKGEVHPSITLNGERGVLTGHIDHLVYENLESMFQTLNRYSTAAAKQAFAEGKIPPTWQTARRFFSRFYKSYVQRKGYREGWRGVALGLFSGLYPVLTHLKTLEMKSHSS